jgi:hypothetical protein
MAETVATGAESTRYWWAALLMDAVRSDAVAAPGMATTSGAVAAATKAINRNGFILVSLFGTAEEAARLWSL